jgi:glycosyltransferase involved in cell wall biosynthesis
VTNARPCNVLQIISSGGFYGAEAVVVTLSKALHEAGVNSKLGIIENLHVPNYELFSRAKQLNLNVELIRSQGRLDLSLVDRLCTVMDKDEINIVHCHGYKADIIGYLAARRSGRKVIATCHGWYDPRLFTRFYSLLDLLVLRRFDALVPVSEAGEKILLRAGVRRDRVRRIDNGIEVSEVRQRSQTTGHTIGMVGRLAPEKGVDDFIRALPLVFAEIPRCQVLLVGEGQEREKLQDLCSRLGIRDQVEFVGHVTDVDAVYAQLDVLAMSSVAENLPMTLLEALSRGVAVVTTPVGSIPRIVRHNQNGLLVPPREPAALGAALLRLLQDGELRRRLGDEGRKSVIKEFSADAMARNYLGLYQELLG